MRYAFCDVLRTVSVRFQLNMGVAVSKPTGSTRRFTRIRVIVVSAKPGKSPQNKTARSKQGSTVFFRVMAGGFLMWKLVIRSGKLTLYKW
jgi:hypothetical protein